MAPTLPAEVVSILDGVARELAMLLVDQRIEGRAFRSVGIFGVEVKRSPVEDVEVLGQPHPTETRCSIENGDEEWTFVWTYPPRIAQAEDGRWTLVSWKNRDVCWPGE